MASNIKFPQVNVPILSGAQAIDNTDQKVLFVGQSNNSPTVNTLHEDVSTSATEINALFGEGSILAQMIIAARAINSEVQFDAIDAVSGTTDAAAEAIVTFTNDATNTETMTINIGNEDDGAVTINVAVTNTPTIIAAAFETAINLADGVGQKMGITASASVGELTLTNDNLGAIGNFMSISISSEVTGTTIALDGFFTNGNGDAPDYSGVFDVVGQERYQTICFPYVEEVDNVLIPLVDSRFNASDTVSDGVGVTFFDDTYANIISQLEAFNSQSTMVICQEHLTDGLTYDSSDIFELPWVVAAQFAAIRAIRRQEGTSIADLVISKNGALDSFGGPALSSKPYANTPLSSLPIIPISRGFSTFEISQINDAGGTIFGNNKARNGIIMGQVLTTYKTDSAGDDDDSFKFLNYVDTASTGREYVFNNLQSRFAQTRLTDGDLVKGRDMTNSTNIFATMVGYYQVLSDEDYVVTRKGEDVLQYFKDNLTVSTDLLTGTADITFNLPIVTQLRVINAPMTLTFNIE